MTPPTMLVVVVVVLLLVQVVVVADIFCLHISFGLCCSFGVSFLGQGGPVALLGRLFWVRLTRRLLIGSHGSLCCSV